jgi:hypothetical protein
MVHSALVISVESEVSLWIYTFSYLVAAMSHSVQVEGAFYDGQRFQFTTY